MFFQFFDELRSARVPVTLKEYLALMDALAIVANRLPLVVEIEAEHVFGLLG